MSRKCIMGCPKGFRLHRFPEDTNRRAEWLRILGVKSSVKRLYACSRHFSQEYLFGNRTSKYAVPNNKNVDLNSDIFERFEKSPTNFVKIPNSKLTQRTTIEAAEEIMNPQTNDTIIQNTEDIEFLDVEEEHLKVCEDVFEESVLKFEAEPEEITIPANPMTAASTLRNETKYLGQDQSSQQRVQVISCGKTKPKTYKKIFEEHHNTIIQRTSDVDIMNVEKKRLDNNEDVFKKAVIKYETEPEQITIPTFTDIEKLCGENLNVSQDVFKKHVIKLETESEMVTNVENFYEAHLNGSENNFKETVIKCEIEPEQITVPTFPNVEKLCEEHLNNSEAVFKEAVIKYETESEQITIPTFPNVEKLCEEHLNTSQNNFKEVVIKCETEPEEVTIPVISNNKPLVIPEIKKEIESDDDTSDIKIIEKKLKIPDVQDKKYVVNQTFVIPDIKKETQNDNDKSIMLIKEEQVQILDFHSEEFIAKEIKLEKDEIESEDYVEEFINYMPEENVIEDNK